MEMTQMNIDRVLNTRESFLVDSNQYTIIETCPDNNLNFKGVCVDKFNMASVVTITPEMIPLCFLLYEYRFTQGYIKRDDAINIAVIDPIDGAKRDVNALVVDINSNSISYLYRDRHGQHRTDMLTARVASIQGITIRKLN